MQCFFHMPGCQFYFDEHVCIAPEFQRVRVFVSACMALLTTIRLHERATVIIMSWIFPLSPACHMYLLAGKTA